MSDQSSLPDVSTDSNSDSDFDSDGDITGDRKREGDHSTGNLQWYNYYSNNFQFIIRSYNVVAEKLCMCLCMCMRAHMQSVEIICKY